ncbi:cAMP-binding domain of CRP or a regulatory subunit of cAMP-dependent protein kinases [Tenacibaculum sp. MAR_2009_124]|uniref:Crp/Fnr family transcriptional regulator n=1 Tax=Tenacibaculum sp. MAR_2009_124 TaxID=1250059 RepID=UPI00089A843C|nr:Crp/Fnr family transcriptional regulator [Tenacibaculum sp. MAR_2009_124]SEC94976.1 cAMP-binding domain of CRP or a regulatory subunit of cAMP-dependent protein kinases [Tenacibaculum sp. MAR_2009_124]
MLLSEYFNSSEILNEEDIQLLLSICETRILEKEDLFIQEGEFCNEIAFVTSGYFHSYYTSKIQEEITYCIVFPNDFVSAYSSFISSQKSPISIKALSRVEICVFSKNNLTSLVHTNPNIQRFFAMLNEKYLIKLENRFFQLQKEDANSRYTWLIENHPEFILKMPLKLIASYLGITPRHLSRIRAKMN